MACAPRTKWIGITTIVLSRVVAEAVRFSQYGKYYEGSTLLLYCSVVVIIVAICIRSCSVLTLMV